MLHLTQAQLAGRLGVAQSTVARVEQDEPSGSVTLKTLSRVASAMDCRLVYAIVPNDGSVQSLLQRRAEAAARKTLRQVSTSMSLEDQTVSEEETRAMVEDTADEILRDHPKLLGSDDD